MFVEMINRTALKAKSIIIKYNRKYRMEGVCFATLRTTLHLYAAERNV